MSSTIDTCIEELEDRIQLYNIPVPYDGGELHDIGWGTELLNGSASLTQEEHVQRTLDTDFKLASGLVYGATLLALYDARERTGEEKASVDTLKQLFQNDFAVSHPYVFTSMRLTYTPQGPDQVVHDYGYPNAQQRDADLVGPQRYFAKEDADVLEALFGTRDVKKFNAMAKWLTGKKSYIWRFISKPSQDEECVLALGCSVDGLSFDSSDTGPARGAVVTPSVARQKKSVKKR